jgi:hypothetical protein
VACAEVSSCLAPSWRGSLVSAPCEGPAFAAWRCAVRAHREHLPERLRRRGGVGGNTAGIGAADVPGGAALSESMLRIRMW